MSRLTVETLMRRLDELAREAADTAEETRPLEAIAGDVWVSIDGVARDLEALARDVRSDLVPAVNT